MIGLQQDNGEVWSALGTCPPSALRCSLSSHCDAGHCYLMQDDLQKAYTAYQQALYLLPNPKVRSISPLCMLCLFLISASKEDPKLWYGIGILYDRYGSLDHAEEAFASVLKMDKGMSPIDFCVTFVLTQLALDFDKANEILFRLGIIYKQQGKYSESLDCFDRILRNPPNPLAHADIWFQIGHVFEQQRDVRLNAASL